MANRAVQHLQQAQSEVGSAAAKIATLQSVGQLSAQVENLISGTAKQASYMQITSAIKQIATAQSKILEQLQRANREIAKAIQEAIEQERREQQRRQQRR